VGAAEGDGDEEVAALLGPRQDGAIGDLVGVANAGARDAHRQDGAFVDDATALDRHALAVVRVDWERGDGDGVILAGRIDDVLLAQDVESLQSAGFTDVEGGREVPRRDELVLAETEGSVVAASLRWDGRVGPQEVQELEGVLLMRLPEAGAFRGVGRMPSVAATDQAEGDLSVDGVVAIELFPGQRVEVEPDTAHRL